MTTTEEFYAQVEAAGRKLDRTADELAGAVSAYVSFVEAEYGLDGMTDNAREDLARVKAALDAVRGASGELSSVLYDAR